MSVSVCGDCAGGGRAEAGAEPWRARSCRPCRGRVSPGGGSAGAPLAPGAAHVAGPAIKAAAAPPQPVRLHSRFWRDAASSSAAAMAIDAFLGKWCLVSSEGFEDYMKELGKQPGGRDGREGWMPGCRDAAAGCAVAAGRRGSVQGPRGARCRSRARGRAAARP